MWVARQISCYILSDLSFVNLVWHFKLLLFKKKNDWRMLHHVVRFGVVCNSGCSFIWYQWIIQFWRVILENLSIHKPWELFQCKYNFHIISLHRFIVITYLNKKNCFLYHSQYRILFFECKDNFLSTFIGKKQIRSKN